jgi:hydrogenase expression/formation protein HypE
MKAHPLGQSAARIGEVLEGKPGLVLLETPLGGKRIVGMLEGEHLPRIC